jgi:hypothetical protein
MKDLMNKQLNYRFDGGAVRSERLADLGFRPAYMDYSTLAIYPCTFADGRPAPTHTREGLPDDVVAIRGPEGQVLATKSTLVAGYVRGGYFFTLERAERMSADWPGAPARN